VRGKKKRRGQLENNRVRDQNSKEKVMTTRIRTLLGSILVLMAAMASAQTVQRVTVTVPFSFVAGSHNLPAGDYTIELNYEKDRMVLRSEDGSGNNTVMLASNRERADDVDKSYAIFQRHGTHYFLAAVWSQGAGQTLTPGKLEQELARKNSKGEMARVEARLSPR
jgi:hypothetical protein